MFERTRARHKPKPTNKAKTSKQKTTKVTIFLHAKNPKMGKIVYFAFLKKVSNCHDHLIYYNTELCSFDFAIFKLLLLIYQDF